MKKGFRRITSLIVLLVLLPLAKVKPALPFDGEDFETVNTPRFILHIQHKHGHAHHSAGESDVPADIAQFAIKVLDETFDELTSLLGTDIREKVVLRFISPEKFRMETGAPSWTSAMYYKGEISIPYGQGKAMKAADLNQTLRHEYLHAVMAELSGFRCPAWLDEGLAQMIEGKVNPALLPALKKWLKNNEAIPLSKLKRGFTRLDKSQVAVAYAQSYLAGKYLVDKFGYPAVVKYMENLRDRHEDGQAFMDAFGVSLEDFEAGFANELREWTEGQPRFAL
jgi:hypothetical protein